MKKNKSASSYSNEYLHYDILVRIFLALNVVDRAVVSMVCKSWNCASSNRAVWQKFDLTISSSRATNMNLSSSKMAQFLNYATSLSNGNINCFIFNFYPQYLTDIWFYIAAQRTQNLKRLVLPFKGSLSERGFYTAMASWTGLESITVTDLIHHSYIFSAIHKWCKNIVELKFTFDFRLCHAYALVKYVPNLEILSVRGQMVNYTALCYLLKGLKHLRVVNISHCFIWDIFDNQRRTYKICHLRNSLDISLMNKLMFCIEDGCPVCNDFKWEVGEYANKEPSHEYFENIWRQDEIYSLAH